MQLEHPEQRKTTFNVRLYAVAAAERDAIIRAVENAPCERGTTQTAHVPRVITANLPFLLCSEFELCVQRPLPRSSLFPLAAAPKTIVLGAVGRFAVLKRSFQILANGLCIPQIAQAGHKRQESAQKEMHVCKTFRHAVQRAYYIRELRMRIKQ